MKKQIPSFFLLILLTFGFLFSLTGCNTVRGFGEDISGSSTFVQKKMFGAGDDSSMPVNSSNPPQWPK